LVTERDKLSARTGGDRHTAAGAAKGTCAGLRLDGFERAWWIEVPKLGHRPPDAAWFERGLALLEAEPVPAPTTRPTNDLRPGPGQVAQARRILATALSSIEASRKSGRAPGAAAAQYLRQAVDEYPTTPVADEPRRLLDELTKAPAD
jgi:hypothetical protein